MLHDVVTQYGHLSQGHFTIFDNVGQLFKFEKKTCGSGQLV